MSAVACLGALLAALGNLVVVAFEQARGRVLIVDDDPAIHELVSQTLGEHGFITRGATDAREALHLVRREVPDVVLLDVRLPGISGYQLCRRLRDEVGDAVGIVMISGERTDSLDRATGLLLDADDYLVKPFAIEELIARVERLVRRTRPQPRARSAGLTSRELEILRLLSRGLDHLDIARALVIAPKTVEKHIEHILMKLGVHSRAEAIAFAFQEKLVVERQIADVTRLEDHKRREAASG